MPKCQDPSFCVHMSITNGALTAVFYTTACVTADISAVTRVLA